MAKRQNNLKIPSEHLQGEGSYIMLSALTIEQWEQRQKLVQLSNKAIANEALSEDEREKILKENETQLNLVHAQILTGWDWVDNNDEPLPLPREFPDVWKKLTVREIGFIITQIEQSAIEEKKDETKSPV